MTVNMTEDISVIKSRIVGRKLKNPIVEDPQYNNLYVTYLTNVLMCDGKKTKTYRKVVLPALEMIKEKHREDPCQVLANAIAQVRPSIELRPSPTGHHQIPTDIPPRRSLGMALRFIVQAARKIKKGVKMHEKLYGVIWDSTNGRGEAVERKENLHRTAAANNAFKAF